MTGASSTSSTSPATSATGWARGSSRHERLAIERRAGARAERLAHDDDLPPRGRSGITRPARSSSRASAGVTTAAPCVSSAKSASSARCSSRVRSGDVTAEGRRTCASKSGISLPAKLTCASRRSNPERSASTRSVVTRLRRPKPAWSVVATPRTSSTRLRGASAPGSPSTSATRSAGATRRVVRARSILPSCKGQPGQPSSLPCASATPTNGVAATTDPSGARAIATSRPGCSRFVPRSAKVAAPVLRAEDARDRCRRRSRDRGCPRRRRWPCTVASASGPAGPGPRPARSPEPRGRPAPRGRRTARPPRRPRAPRRRRPPRSPSHLAFHACFVEVPHAA